MMHKPSYSTSYELLYLTVFEIISNLAMSFASSAMTFRSIAVVDSRNVLIAASSLSTEPGAHLDDAIIDQLVSTLSAIWFAGHETNASTTLSSLFELGFNPEVYQQMMKEQDKLIAVHGGIRDVTYNQLSEMPLLDSFISETLRLHPAALSIERIASEDVEILGRFVAKGELLSAST